MLCGKNEFQEKNQKLYTCFENHEKTDQRRVLDKCKNQRAWNNYYWFYWFFDLCDCKTTTGNVSNGVVEMIFTIRTTRGREKTVISSLEARMSQENLNIQSIFYPQELKGYIFVEGEEADVETLVRNLRHVRGIIKKPVPISDLEKFLSDKPKEIILEKGDIVEIVGGPFKDELAKVERIDKVNREATIELLDSPVPIPLTIDVELLRKKSD